MFPKDRINYIDFFMTMIRWNADANQIVTEAQKRWLRTAEICGILQNDKTFPLAAEPANKPPSMTLNCVVWFAIIDLDFWTNSLFFYIKPLLVLYLRQGFTN